MSGLVRYATTALVAVLVLASFVVAFLLQVPFDNVRVSITRRASRRCWRSPSSTCSATLSSAPPFSARLAGEPPSPPRRARPDRRSEHVPCMLSQIFRGTCALFVIKLNPSWSMKQHGSAPVGGARAAGLREHAEPPVRTAAMRLAQPAPTKGTIFMCNHLSNADPFFVCAGARRAAARGRRGM